MYDYGTDFKKKKLKNANTPFKSTKCTKIDKDELSTKKYRKNEKTKFV